jgi:hypothetical protein
VSFETDRLLSSRFSLSALFFFVTASGLVCGISRHPAALLVWTLAQGALLLAFCLAVTMGEVFRERAMVFRSLLSRPGLIFVLLACLLIGGGFPLGHWYQTLVRQQQVMRAWEDRPVRVTTRLAAPPWLTRVVGNDPWLTITEFEMLDRTSREVLNRDVPRLLDVESMRLVGDEVDDSTLAAVSKLPHLRQLTLDSTSVTVAGLERFRAAAPEVTVSQTTDYLLSRVPHPDLYRKRPAPYLLLRAVNGLNRLGEAGAIAALEHYCESAPLEHEQPGRGDQQVIRLVVPALFEVAGDRPPPASPIVVRDGAPFFDLSRDSADQLSSGEWLDWARRNRLRGDQLTPSITSEPGARQLFESNLDSLGDLNASEYKHHLLSQARSLDNSLRIQRANASD